MSVSPPILDARNFQDIRDELNAQTRAKVPEWTPETADAGVMLQIIFARLMELVLQRLNRVPEKNLMAFLDAMGVALLPPTSARVPLTFSLLPGTLPTLLPAGTQAGTVSTDRQSAIAFETEHDLTVLPAQLTSAFTIDPTWDRHTDHTASLSGQNPFAFTPFVGTKQVPHTLHIGTSLLEFTGEVRSVLSFTWQGFSDRQEIVKLFNNLQYHYKSQGFVKLIDNVQVNESAQLVSLVFSLSDSIDKEALRGPGLELAIQARWLRILALPFPDVSAAQTVSLKNLKFKIESMSDLLPEAAYANSTTLDVTKDFLPFGETPARGDALYLGSTEVFAKPGVEAKVQFVLPEPKLVFEVFVRDSTGKERIIQAQLNDNTAAFTRNGMISGGFIRTQDVGQFGSFETSVRIRLTGAYSRPPRIKDFQVRDQNRTLRKPDSGSLNLTPIDFTRPFSLFGNDPTPADTLSFTMKGGFPTTQNNANVFEIIIEVTLEPNDPGLDWEYLSEQGWAPVQNLRDNTLAFRGVGSVTSEFVVPPSPRAIQAEVNGVESYWVRVRIRSGDYGRLPEFDLLDPKDPRQGFVLRPGTGNLGPPRVSSLSLRYTAEDAQPILVTQAGHFYHSHQTSQNFFSPFFKLQNLPEPYTDAEPTFYLGFDAAFPERAVRLYFSAKSRAFTGSNSKRNFVTAESSAALPRLLWEYFDGAKWNTLTVFDNTNNLTESGALEFLTPADIQSLIKFDLTPRYWIRARSSSNNPFDTQQLSAIYLNTVSAIQATTVANETLGSSTEQPGQTLRFAATPVMTDQRVLVREPEAPTGKERDVVELEEGSDAIVERPNATQQRETWVRWHEVPNFLTSEPHSRHYTLDRVTGLLTFGDGKHGLIPPFGTDNIAVEYRYGGGTAGNVGKGAITQLRSPLPGVRSVTNPIAAEGGAEVESSVMAAERGPQTLAHRDRAVTAADLEWLTRQAGGTRIARVKCLPNTNRDLRFELGWATLLIVPQGDDARLSPSAELIRQVENYMEARTFVGLIQQAPSCLNVIGPGYVRIAVVAKIVPKSINEAQLVKQRVMNALGEFFHPLRGGRYGSGWEFGRDVFASEVSQLIEGVPGIDHVAELQLMPNVAQRQLNFEFAIISPVNIPAGTLMVEPSWAKAAILAEAVPARVRVEKITVTGFKEGDRITKVLDLKYQSGAGGSIIVDTFDSDTSGFPAGSIVKSFDGRLSTRLRDAIPPRTRNLSNIRIEDFNFGSKLNPGERLTVFYPFPMTVTNVTAGVESFLPVQLIDIEPYQPALPFSANSIIATLDNCIRLPLQSSLLAENEITSIVLQDLIANDQIIFLGADGTGALNAIIKQVKPVADVVYLDDNFLVFSGAHQITIVQD